MEAGQAYVESTEGFSMQNKELERGDPSGYAFGVKCGATLKWR